MKLFRRSASQKHRAGSAASALTDDIHGSGWTPDLIGRVSSSTYFTVLLTTMVATSSIRTDNLLGAGLLREREFELSGVLHLLPVKGVVSFPDTHCSSGPYPAECFLNSELVSDRPIPQIDFVVYDPDFWVRGCSI